MRKQNNRVFLGGTCNESTWREKLIPKLKIDYFNPVVADWNEEAQRREEQEKKDCTFSLTVFTENTYTMEALCFIAAVVDASNKDPYRTIFCVLNEAFYWSDKERFFLGMISNLVENNGAKVCKSLEEVAEYLNNQTFEEGEEVKKVRKEAMLEKARSGCFVW